MKNQITATAQGLLTYDKNGKPQLERYTQNFQSKSDYKPKHIAQTSTDLEKIHLNMVQRQMFRRLMYGLKEYTPEQMSTLSPSAISKIVEDYKKAKRALHIMKAKKYYYAETKLMNAIFPTFNLGSKDHDWFLELPKTVTLRSLGISTKEVIEEFVKRKLLPKNFFNITIQNVSLNG
jgi:hypothetical protein